MSGRTGVPIPTIKYYLREGLLPRGERTSPNQAQYDERHESRLRLVRALVEVGGLSIATTRDVLAYLEQPGPTLNQRLGRAVGSITPVKATADEEARSAATEVVDGLVERRGWRINVDHPAYANLVEVVAGLSGAVGEGLLANVDRYAEAAEVVAKEDLALVAQQTDVDAAVETAIVGTVAGDLLLAALRRAAQVNESGRVFGPT
ncbi:MAG: MerR family transcriptional regulator [Streptosporangiales bacterium]|nr:MerR family transcriptional regulator [Streptosporangiales bacterium]